MLGLSFPSTTFSYIKFSSRYWPCTWWALNQRKTTISAHLLGSSMILKVFHYFSLLRSAEPTLWVYFFPPRNVLMPHPSILGLKFVCAYSSGSCTYILYYNFFIPFPIPQPNPLLLYPEGLCQYNFR